MNIAQWFMVALLVLDAGAAIAFWWVGQGNNAGLWAGYAWAQFFWYRAGGGLQ